MMIIIKMNLLVDYGTVTRYGEIMAEEIIDAGSL